MFHYLVEGGGEALNQNVHSHCAVEIMQNEQMAESETYCCGLVNSGQVQNVRCTTSICTFNRPMNQRYLLLS